MKINLPVTGSERTYDDETTIISMTDLKGVMTYVNRDFIDVSGFREEELIGKSHNLVRHPDMPSEAFKDLWDTIQQGFPWRGVVKNRCKNGDHYWVDAYVTPVYEGERLVGYQSVRTQPTRQQIAAAEALYQKLRNKTISRLPKKRSLLNTSLKQRLSASLILLALLISGLLALNTGLTQRPLLQEHRERLTALAKIIKADDGVAAERALDELAREISEAERRVATVQWASLLMGGAALIALPLIGLLFARTVISPLLRTVDIAKGVAAGNLRQRIQVTANDELGQLLQAMKLMQARLQTVLGRVAESAEALATAATQVSAVAERTHEGMDRQASETEQVAAAMHEMAATVSEVAANSAHAAGAANEADRQSAQGKAVTQRTRQAIDSLAAEVERAAEVVGRVEEKSGNIGNITAVIRSIAEQTNLLALNAAIEAARAGESGRGFAVVADEVRTLAQRTQDATVEIEMMLKDLKGGIGEAVEVMANGRSQAGSVLEEMRRTEQALDAIAAAVATMNDTNAQIATSAEEQSAVAEEMNRNVSVIGELTGETADGAAEFAQNGAEVARMARRLSDLVTGFHVREKEVG